MEATVVVQVDHGTLTIFCIETGLVVVVEEVVHPSAIDIDILTITGPNCIAHGASNVTYLETHVIQ